MAKQVNRKVVGVKSSSVAMYVGTFWSIIGLGVAILHSLRSTVEFANSTDSVLSGMAFGLATGIVSIIVLPFLYFAFGWIIGLVQGYIFNVVAESSGGITLKMIDE